MSRSGLATTGVSLLWAGVALLPSAARCDDWPGWRGTGDGVASAGSAPTSWSRSDGVAWMAELPGRGVSSPVVGGERVVVTAASGPREKTLHVVSLDARNGALVWERRLTATGGTQCHPKTSMAAPTPIVDGGRVLVLFASCDAAAFLEDGTPLWCRALGLDFPELSNQVGMASSPVVRDGHFIAALETDSEAFVISLDAATGETRWKLPRERGINWTSPLLRGQGGSTALVLQSGKGLSAVDAGTGKELWRLPAGLDGIASGAVVGDLLVVPGKETLGVRGPVSPGGSPQVVWRSNRLRASTASFLALGGNVHGLSSAGVLVCARAADGEILWQERLKGPFSASPVACGGKIYCVNEEGTTFVVDPSAEKKVAAECPLGETILASPAVAGGAIYLRGERTVWRLGGGSR